MHCTEDHASFGGRQQVWRHDSEATGVPMSFGLYLPPAVLRGEKRPVLYWLSGLTCTEQNFITKAGVQMHAARHELIVVTPDTSPRGAGVPDDPGWDLGQGAGFYVDATRPPWSSHFRMESYVAKELPELVESRFPALPLRAISGHSMGGHGALTLALRHPGRYASVSAFAPIAAPTRVPWGRKAFSAYLGDDPAAWAAHDAVSLVAEASERLPLLVDQGEADEFLEEQLRPQLLQQACEAAGHPLRLRLHPGYDHSHYFVASFIGDHLDFHAERLRESRPA